ncbi:MAG: hypothetical protein NTW79_03225 [Candidatus Berkelbacteria bacterium]|nr:hypothetical protein [Candidatus Berkelbacteria bacterium]
MKPVWIIVISVVITAGIIGGGTYYFLNKKTINDKDALQSQITDLNKKLTDAQTTASSTTSTTTPTTTDETASWTKYKSDDLGISFKFPVFTATAKYFLLDGSKGNTGIDGISYGWNIKRTDTENKPDWTYVFAGGVSQDYSAGKSKWFTENYNWVKKNSKYYLEPFESEVHPVKEVKAKSGGQAIIITSESDRNAFMGEGENFIGGSMAVVNFPDSYTKSKKIKSISFYFYDTISVDQIQKVVDSVELAN